MIFLAGVLAGVQMLMAWLAVSASITALTYSQTSLEMMSSILGWRGAFGPLCTVRPDLCTQTSRVAGFFSTLGRRLIPWSKRAAMA